MILLYILLPMIEVSFYECSTLSNFAYKYVAEPHDENIFTPCNDYPDFSIDKIFDVSNYKTITLTNGSFHIMGNISLKIDVEEDRIPLKVEIFRKIRGSWTNTIYNIHRVDTCTAIYRPTEIWYKFLKDIPEAQRKCPLKKGMVYSVDIVPEFTFDFPDRSLEGDYRIRSIMTYGISGKIALCFDIDYALYRI